ncbi:hypothetical protein [Chitinophaga nivalis]|uniref:Lipoprotein n=1 Tax=Chitinophaga nivalis TaxID=2991709 RepID=A0ABT3IGC5_9BACT|nr:hypothetical protein [Chitinophaga nivalis]MCW3467308.1 hypothetical protein [Chitinophaga nivalis]MCW3483000.1 hypothetical protein [Chitinophaga nivalis]
MRSYLRLLFLSLLLHSCAHTEKPRAYYIEKVQQLERLNIALFNDIFIEARFIRNDTFIAYSFIKELNGEDFYLPNFSLYTNTLMSSPKMLDAFKYGQHFGHSTLEEALHYSKGYADSIISTFVKMNVWSVLGRNPGMLIFYLNDKTYLIYAPDKTKITNEYWIEKMPQFDRIKSGWYFGKDE